MRTVGFAGTAKNTGKTTSTLHVLGLCRQAGLQPALTSIGYDGENLDNITGLLKPRYTLQEGELAATARSCLSVGSARLKVLAQTGIQTALGEVIIAQVERAGTVLLAGPNTKTSLLPVLAEFNRLQADVTLIDGALNRCVPLSAADAIVFATGAALDDRILLVADHSAALACLFQIPPTHAPGLSQEAISLIRDDGHVVQYGGGSILSHQAALALAEAIPPACCLLSIPGACQPEYLAALLRSVPRPMDRAELVLAGPLKMLASASPIAWQAALAEARQAGWAISCLETASLRLITTNPWYPAYDAGKMDYSPATVQASALRESVAKAVPGLPVVDVCQPYDDKILEILGIRNSASASREVEG